MGDLLLVETARHGGDDALPHGVDQLAVDLRLLEAAVAAEPAGVGLRHHPQHHHLQAEAAAPEPERTTDDAARSLGAVDDGKHLQPWILGFGRPLLDRARSKGNHDFLPWEELEGGNCNERWR